MDWLILILVPVVVLLVLALCGFAGCGFPEPSFYTPPANLQAKATGPTRVELTWLDFMSGAASYFVERMHFGQTLRTQVGKVSLGSFVDETPGLTDGTSYSYIVRLDSTANAETNLASVTTPPAAPTGVAAVAVDASSIKVTWAPGKPTFVYSVEHRPAGTGGGFDQVPVGNANSYTHSGLAAGTSREYRVIAAVAGVDGEKRSDPSVSATATTTGAPPPPPPGTWKQAFAATLTTNPPERDGQCLVQRLAAPLENGGTTKVRVTLRGSTTATLILDKVTISEAAAGGGAKAWDSAAAPVTLMAAGNPVITIPASTAVVVEGNYALNVAKDQLIAFDINSPAGAVRSGTRNGATAYARAGVDEAGVQIRSTGYGTNNNTVFMVEKVEVM
jgi:hypothetical protein